MHSRTIALAAAFALMFLIVTGSLVLQQTIGHAADRAPEPVAPAVLPPAAVLAAVPGAGAAPTLPPAEAGAADAKPRSAIRAATGADDRCMFISASREYGANQV